MSSGSIDCRLVIKGNIVEVLGRVRDSLQALIPQSRLGVEQTEPALDALQPLLDLGEANALMALPVDQDGHQAAVLVRLDLDVAQSTANVREVITDRPQVLQHQVGGLIAHDEERNTLDGAGQRAAS